MDRNTTAFSPGEVLQSLPHGGVDRNEQGLVDAIVSADVAPSRGRGSKRGVEVELRAVTTSLPHGGVDRNGSLAVADVPVGPSLPHGGVDRNFASMGAA